MNSSTSINILFADDDKDDCLFFKDALDELTTPVSLTTVNDGEELMQYLQTAGSNLPQIIFLDLNMPRKNGYDCLHEIKTNALLKKIPVVIYSTSYDEEMANRLFDSGANYYICKPANYEELKNVIHLAVQYITESNGEHERTIKPLIF